MVEWVTGISIAIFYLIQTALADKIQIFTASPNLVLVAVICGSIVMGREKGIIAALFAGFMADILSNGIFGGNLLVYTYAAALAGTLMNNFFGKNSITAAFTTFVISLLLGIITAVIMFLTKTDRNIGYIIIAAELPRSIYNCIVAAIYYAFLDNIAGRSYR